MGRAMEPDVPVKHFGRLILLLLCAGASPASHAMDCPLLVVASRAAPIDYLTRNTARRLYLGVPYQTDIGQLQPALNESDPMLQEVFLQKILFLSKNSYRRILARRMVQLRIAGPARYENTDKLIAALRANARMISYLWQSQIPEDGQLKVLLEVPCEND